MGKEKKKKRDSDDFLDDSPEDKPDSYDNDDDFEISDDILEDEDSPEKPDFEIGDPLGLGDDFYSMLNEQMNALFDQFPNYFPKSMRFSPESLKQFYNQIFKQMQISPKDLEGKSPQDILKMMGQGKMGVNGPFMFGVNMNIDKEGNMKVNPFGNMPQKDEGNDKSEYYEERDPLIELYEENDEIIVVAEIPGVDKKDIVIEASENELEITAKTNPDSGYHRKYHKIVSLPSVINPKIAKARNNNGVLEVRLQKIGDKAKRRQINIE